MGLGNVYETSSPCPNNSMIDFRIKQIAIGISHSAALTSGGQLFTWGSGENGQLGLYVDEACFTNTPKGVPGAK